MDKIYDIPKSKPVNFKKFLHDYVAELGKTEFPKTDADVKRLMGLEKQAAEYAKVKASISLELLDSPDDVRIIPYQPGVNESKRKLNVSTISSASRLHTMQKLINDRNTSVNSTFARSQQSYKQVHTATKPENHNLEPFSDVVVSIRFYRPKADAPLKRRTYPTFSEEFQCLGSNFLTELRDKVTCMCNKKRFFELSEKPTAKNPDETVDSGFFFIEDTFYNDMRNPLSHDYSEVIKDWANKTARGYEHSNFKTRRMEEVRFIELEVSLGFPQLYQHHGNCEHLFTFSSIELLSKYNCLVRELYPVLKSMNAYNAKSCNMCGKREFSYVVKNSKRQLHDPAYLCSVCLFSFHYVNGKKVDAFTAYRIVSYSEKLDDHESFVVDNLDNDDSDELSDDAEMDVGEDFKREK